MGVYIPNMKMPEHCGVCRFAVDGWCYAYGKPNIDALANDGRTNFCPLIPIPPHGDLIDRNKLYEKTAEWEAQALHMVEVTMHDEDTTEWRKWSTVLTERSAFKFDVADAPTIIPAEESE